MTRADYLNNTAPATGALSEAAITRLSMVDPVFGLIETHRKANAAHLAAIAEQARLELSDPEMDYGYVGDTPCHDDAAAFRELLSTPTNTFPGAFAKVEYLRQIAERDAWRLDHKGDALRLLESFALTLVALRKRV